LPYCVTLRSSASAPPRGIGGSEVLVLAEGSLDAYYSLLPDTEKLGDVEDLKRAALDFHSVITDILCATATLPLSFPTLLPEVEDLRHSLRERHAEFVRQLEAMGDAVQMEIRFSHAPSQDVQASGTDYLRQKAARARQFHAADELCRRELDSLVREWRSRESGEDVKLVARVGRGAVEDFRRRAAEIALPPGVNGRVSGPWPAMEFVELAEPCPRL